MQLLDGGLGQVEARQPVGEPRPGLAELERPDVDLVEGAARRVDALDDLRGPLLVDREHRDERHVCARAQHVLEQLERRLSGLVEVVDDEHERLLGRGAAQVERERLERGLLFGGVGQLHLG